MQIFSFKICKVQLGPKKLRIFFQNFHFSKKIPEKYLSDFIDNLVKNHKKWKFCKKKFPHFFWSKLWLQKCMLREFFKNICTISNASYFAVENFERSGPFFSRFILVKNHMVIQTCLRNEFKILFMVLGIQDRRPKKRNLVLFCPISDRMYVHKYFFLDQAS